MNELQEDFPVLKTTKHVIRWVVITLKNEVNMGILAFFFKGLMD